MGLRYQLRNGDASRPLRVFRSPQETKGVSLSRINRSLLVLFADPTSEMPRPTITIDTSAVNAASPANTDSDAVTLYQPSTPQRDHANSPAPEVPPPPLSMQHNNGTGHNSQARRGSIPELRASGSFESRESRPASSHNVSSPILQGGGRLRGYLSVPVARSRQNSIDTEEVGQSIATSSENSHALTASRGSVQSDRDESKHGGLKYDNVVNNPDALRPDPGTEEDFKVDDNKFAFSPGLLHKLLSSKSLATFYAIGGLSGLERGLRTDRRTGLSLDETTLEGTVSLESTGPPPGKAVDDASDTLNAALVRETTQGTTRELPRNRDDEPFYDRKRVFRDNRIPEAKAKSLLQLMWITYNDKVLILLSIAAAVSLAIGLYQTFGTSHTSQNPPVEWVEGVAILVAIAVVVVVGSLNDYQKERQFVKLNTKMHDRKVNVIRSGNSQELSIYDILVGDVVLVEPGDVIPADGVFIEGHSVKCDESQTTGESDLMRKKAADEVYTAIRGGEDLRKMDPFVLSGSQVIEGVGSFLVTATGVNSDYGRIKMALREDPEATPLQSKLNHLAETIAKLGGAAGLLLFVVLFIQFLIGLPHNTDSSLVKGREFMNIFIVTVTIIVVAVPEGLPLAVTLALAFATTRMTKDNNLVRHLKACEVMGNATAICSDKTGTLTQNRMLVVAGAIGTNSHFGGATRPAQGDELRLDNAPVAVITPQEVVNTLSQDTKTLLKDSIATNSTAYEGEAGGQQEFIGSKTETSLLIFARDYLGMGPVSQERSNAKIVQLIPFDSKRMCMGVVLHLDKGMYRLYVKGAPEILLEQCTEIIRDPTKDISSIPMSNEHRSTLSGLISSYGERSLRTIGLVYRDFDRWPPRSARRVSGNSQEAVFEDVFKNMVLLGVVGIQDPLREGVKEAVQACKSAGVRVRMVTGDNPITAKAIATECGIYTPGGVVMEGPAFRKLSKNEQVEVIPSLQVLARSSPEDKRKLVKRLKELGETVAVTGDGTNDAPALKTADVGFSMGISGTEVAKEASAIILMDDNFASIVKAIMWGRSVNDAVKKFLQFQITINVVAVVLTFISAISSGTGTSVLTAVQLLWINLIMDTMAALALATDAPMPSILDRKPELKSAPIITITMWKMIAGEAIYQLAITLMLEFGSTAMYDYTPEEKANIPTFVFNTFVWMQIFNQWK